MCLVNGYGELVVKRRWTDGRVALELDLSGLGTAMINF